MNNKVYAFINGIILNGNEDMSPQYDKIIFIKNGIIGAIADKNTDISGYEVIDLKGRYIMPGLINAHVHIAASGNPPKREVDGTKLVKLITSNALLRAIGKRACMRNAKTQLMSGVTTIRAVGGILDWDSCIRDKILSGKIDGPRILAANAAIAVPNGHMVGTLAYAAESEEEVIKYVREIAKGKPDLIKLMITGGVLDATVKGEPGVLKMPPSYVKAACDEAHKLGFIVAAHVEGTEGVRVALENGVDTIEHGSMVDDEIIDLFKKKKAAQITTVSPSVPFAFFDRSVSGASEMDQYNGKVALDGTIECGKACLENGIPVGLGTDSGCNYITHYNMWMELQFFHKFCGVSNRFALYTATKRNAEILKIDNVTGTIEVGKSADLIITQDNPLDNLSALKDISLVMARGKLYNNPRVKKNDKVELEMEKFL